MNNAVIVQIIESGTEYGAEPGTECGTVWHLMVSRTLYMPCQYQVQFGKAICMYASPKMKKAIQNVQFINSKRQPPNLNKRQICGG